MIKVLIRAGDPCVAKAVHPFQFRRIAFLFGAGLLFCCAESDAAKLTANNGAAGDKFGNAVSLSGSNAVIGSMGFSNYKGCVYAFQRAGNVWGEKQTITANDGAEGDQFGNAVDIYNNVIVVGAPEAGPGGSVYVYEFNGVFWAEKQVLTDPSAGSFGYAVSINTDRTILVGAPFTDIDVGESQGRSYVYTWNGAQWVLSQILLAQPELDFDFFGNSVSMHGGYAVIGASGDANETGLNGRAFFYRKDVNNQWVQTQVITPADGELGDSFGGDVDIYGKTVVVGSSRHPYPEMAPNPGPGAAYIYNLVGNNWVLKQKVTASDGAVVDRFGCAVAVNSSSFIVGAESHDVNNVSDAGQAYVFRYASNTWSEIQKLTSLNTGSSPCMANNGYGCDVAVNSLNALIGEEYGDKISTYQPLVFDAGAAYTHTLPLVIFPLP